MARKRASTSNEASTSDLLPPDGGLLAVMVPCSDLLADWAEQNEGAVVMVMPDRQMATARWLKRVSIGHLLTSSPEEITVVVTPLGQPSESWWRGQLFSDMFCVARSLKSSETLC